jgi:lactate dehydrogenase-like 2-hydroxyacid dehydrogenase
MPGNRVANIGRALGMSALIADRKGLPESSVRPGRASFEETLKRSTIIMITVPLTPDTQSLISTPEFALMRPNAVIINVARGGIIDEEALVEALRQKRIAGAATDVYSKEPVGKDNPLVRNANKDDIKGRLILSPHLAWYAKSSIEKLQKVMGENVDSWAKGEPLNLVI